MNTSTSLPSPKYDRAREHPTFPEPAQPASHNQTTHPQPPAGDDLGAVDYRGDPSATGPAPRQGTAVGPMPDNTIVSYDLPDEPAGYDHMGQA